METTLIKEMLKHHNKIHILFDAFKKKHDKESFELFKWELEKHFFAEEKVIFTKVNENDAEIVEMIKNVAKEHDAMLKIISSIEKNLTNTEKIEEFERLLKKHQISEDNELYPTMELELNKETIAIMLKKLKGD
jgi:hemerythrin superfamily protein